MASTGATATRNRAFVRVTMVNVGETQTKPRRLTLAPMAATRRIRPSAPRAQVAWRPRREKCANEPLPPLPPPPVILTMIDGRISRWNLALIDRKTKMADVAIAAIVKKKKVVFVDSDSDDTDDEPESPGISAAADPSAFVGLVVSSHRQHAVVVRQEAAGR
jgi:hypothetical protein